jgi:hypothetical protein
LLDKLMSEINSEIITADKQEVFTP